MLVLAFVGGTLEIRDAGAHAALLPSACQWDPRTRCHRAPALAYADVVRALHAAKAPYDDRARGYEELPQGMRLRREPRPYQSEAIAAWRAARGRGVVVLPTGAGKTHVALMAIDDKRRNALVVTPTLDLVRQWYDALRTTFGLPVGLVGGGEHDVRALTVTTYDSAHLHMEHLGARFGLLVFDEAHHLPGASYALAARLSLAPFRLGLTATPERADGRESELEELIGPIVLRRDVTELAGEFLADYDVETIGVELTADERAEYDHERALYRGFVARNGIRFDRPQGWGEFVMLSARSDDGRRAMRAYQRQRELAFGAKSKLEALGELLELHRLDRAIVFTQDNATAYRISRRFLVPVITHQTKVR